MNKKFQILLVGAGSLGIRYLQGLSNLNNKSKIYVIDPNPNALVKAKYHLECYNLQSVHEFLFFTDYNNIPNKIDLCLVVTNSDVRLNVIKIITKRFSVRYWILEKILAQNINEIKKMKKLLHFADGVWVNQPRRIYKWYREIFKHMPKNRKMKIYGTGGSWGMACNSIHFVDLLNWFSNEILESLDTSNIKDWHPSKRLGFWEINGIIKFQFSGGSLMELTCDNSSEPFLLNFEYNTDKWFINEMNGTCTNSAGLSIDGKIEYQSQITGPIVDLILSQGECFLPTFLESSKNHCVFISALLNHWNVYFNKSDSVLPIT